MGTAERYSAVSFLLVILGDFMSKALMVDKREKYYKRNYAVFMAEGFFFAFALSIFSYTTVLPVYIENLSDNRILISMLAFIFFGFSNLSSIFSCVIAVNAKSAKWLTIIICGLQRIGQFLIYLSTLAVTGSTSLALVVFFGSYGIYSITAGMSLPVFNNLVSRVIHRNVSSFFGSYNLFGAVSGVLGSQFVSYIMEAQAFPDNFSTMFLAGVVSAVIATFVLVFGIKEIPLESVQKMRFRDLASTISGILKNNHSYRGFLLVRVIIAAAEMTIPFYIIKVSMVDGVSAGVVGTANTILLISNLVFSKLLGGIGDRKNPFFILRLGSIMGVLATFVALIVPNEIVGYVLFVFVSASILGVSIATSASSIIYSKGERVSLYTATVGVCTAPVYSLFAIIGGFVANRFGENVIFILSMSLYLAALIIASILNRKYNIEN